jgi:hypothetical protein
MIPGLLLSLSGVVVAGLGFVNRDRPEWQRAMPILMLVAVGQVLLGLVSASFLR